MRLGISPRVRHGKVFGVGIVVALVFIGVAAASARPTVAGPGPSAKALAAAKIAAKIAAERSQESRFGIPSPATPNPNAAELPYGAPVTADAVAKRAKVAVSLPAAPVLGYVQTCLFIPATPDLGIPATQTCCPDATTTVGCPSSLIVKAPASNDTTGSITWTELRGRTWFGSPRGAAKPYGTLPSTKVQLLGFGALPATATVTLQQIVGRNGQVEPLALKLLNATVNPGAPDDLRIAGFPLAKPAGDFQSFNQLVTLSGRLQVRISDLRVDGRAIEVGNRCATSTPATLRYSSPRGWFSTLQPVAELSGRPGEFQPLGDSASTPPQAGVAHATLDLPRFENCRDGAGDLSALVTSLASGPRNPVAVRPLNQFLQCRQTDNPEDFGFDCPAYPGDPRLTQQQAQSFGAASAPTISPSSRLARSIRVLGRAQQKRVLNRYPTAFRRELQKAVRAQ